ncbi:MAG: amidohydrolase [Planctomycetes bacterium]|nr:amidohydrolase [Planctomycetota bacterium]
MNDLIYDVHNHVGLDFAFYLRGWWPYASTARDMLEHLEANRIDRAIVFPFALPSAFDPYAFARHNKVELLPHRFPFDRENEAIIREVERIDKQCRLRVLAMIDPSRQVFQQVRNLEKLQGRYVGLKLQGTILRSSVISLLGEGRPMMDFASEHRLPMLIHTSIDAEDTWSQVMDCIKIAEKFPRIRFNLAHSLRFYAPGLKQAAQMPNVWVDCSAHLAHCRLARGKHSAVAKKPDRVEADYTSPGHVLEVIHEMMGGKYMWGSDSPFMSWCDDTLKLLHTYKEEADVFHALPPAVKLSMGSTAPRAWLLDKDTPQTREPAAAE